MIKKILVKKYGEYGIPYKLAKKFKLFSIAYSLELSEIKRMIVECNELGDSDLMTSDNVLVVMTLENFDIEFTQYGMNDITNKLETGFYCCANYDDGWHSEGFADLLPTLELLDNGKENFEEAMYNSMIEYMKRDGFTWSTKN